MILLAQMKYKLMQSGGYSGWKGGKLVVYIIPTGSTRNPYAVIFPRMLQRSGKWLLRVGGGAGPSSEGTLGKGPYSGRPKTGRPFAGGPMPENCW